MPWLPSCPLWRQLHWPPTEIALCAKRIGCEAHISGPGVLSFLLLLPRLRALPNDGAGHKSIIRSAQTFAFDLLQAMKQLLGTRRQRMVPRYHASCCLCTRQEGTG